MTPDLAIVIIAAIGLYGTMVYVEMFVPPQPVPIVFDRSR